MQFKHMIDCIDTHTGGEPTRIITSGFPKIPGKTILEKRAYVLENFDDLRKLMMLEPRGHSGMYGCILCEPVSEDGDFAVLFTHNEGLSSMCGHATIGLTKTAFEMGMLIPKEGENIIKIDAPCGRIESSAHVKDGKVEYVSFKNVSSFIYKENIFIHVDGVGNILTDIVYCGAFYIYVDVTKIKLHVTPEHVDDLVRIGMKIKHQAMEEHTYDHPTEPGINWLYGTIFYEPLVDKGEEVFTKNVCIFAEGQIDRSPTGSGTSGRAALHYAKGELRKDQTLVNASIIDTVMRVTILNETMVGKYPAVDTRVSGTSHIMGFSKLVLDPEDPLPTGFRISGS